ncbi:MAG: ribbon-helix-helix domain-containing protein [Propionibacteriaceae bacterium]|nr:ribbon-helix-helix domain-containing protein [Propionibacteriaceae bacterium]
MSTHKVNLGSLGQITIAESDIEEIDLDDADIRVAGERLTEARAEQLAREIAARHGRLGGRPPLPEHERASVQKAVRLTPAQAKRLADAANSRGVPESELLRKALDAYLASA